MTAKTNINENKYKYLIDLWNKFDTKIDKNKKKFIDNCFKEFLKKIVTDVNDEKLKLAEYTNRKNSNGENCDYFCTFMENTSSEIYGSASAGNAEYFGIKKNDDNETYFISKNINEDSKPCPKSNIENTTKIFKNVLLPYLNDICTKKGAMSKLYKKIEVDNLISSKVMLRKIIAMNNVGDFLYIYSDEAINIIYDFFIEESNATKLTNIEKNSEVTTKIQLLFQNKPKGDKNDYMIKLSRFIWSIFGSSIQLESKNMILHGAPGTGKTYSVKNTVKNIILKQGGKIEEQLVFTQFHPSYSYEDFIDGIKPTGIDEKTGQLKLELKNGSFKELCKFATNTLKNERMKKKKDDELTKFFFVADEINRAELSRVFGELLICLEEDYRIDFDEEGIILNKENLITTQNATLDTNPVYKLEGKNKFGVPANIYFLGTMNDIDKSVDSFDMALRRRFFWKEVRCNYDFIDTLYNNEEFTMMCKNLNRYITGYNEESKNRKVRSISKVKNLDPLRLGTSYEIGHAYFKDLYKIDNTNINKLWISRIEPLLKEYLRADYSQDEILNELSKAKTIFTLPKAK